MALEVSSPASEPKEREYYPFKATIIAGLGLFSDSYDLFSFPPVMRLIGRIYYDDTSKTYGDLFEVPATVATTMVGLSLLGTVIGQIVFGQLGDRYGRTKLYGIPLLLMVVSSIGCGLSMGRSRPLVLTSLGFFRFSLGLGIGGDYPLSATILSEFSNKRTRGKFMTSVFSLQGFGIVLSSLVIIVVCAIFDRATNYPKWDETPEAADVAWRIILMIGAIPAALTCYWRMMMPETPSYTASVDRSLLGATEMELASLSLAPSSHSTPYPLFSKQFLRRHGRDLFACSATWLLLDVVFYCINLFQSRIYNSYIPNKMHSSAFGDAYSVAKLQAIVACCSTILGYVPTFYFIDKIGRVKIQMLGFSCMAVALLAMGIPYNSFWDKHPKNVGFMIFYGLTFFFSNFGPNTTTFIVPAELFPVRFRSTCHGISGAFGKIGAIIGSVGFIWASSNKEENGNPKAWGMTISLLILAGVCLMGMGITYFFSRETMGRSLEENEIERDDGRCLLRGCFPSSCTGTEVAAA